MLKPEIVKACTNKGHTMQKWDDVPGMDTSLTICVFCHRYVRIAGQAVLHGDQEGGVLTTQCDGIPGTVRGTS